MIISMKKIYHSFYQNFVAQKLHFVNDIKQVNEAQLFNKIQVNTNFSVSYIALLVGSSIICTLGLLLNAAPVVIGGMIIAPLMWPLLKISIGISYERAFYIRQAVVLLFYSLLIAFVSSFLITLISPVKLINAEILARTTPTLLDIIVALAAGGVAALAITQPRISESLAGVAIATSLMPPLSVSGIGLALLNYTTFTGALLLFFANVVSIIFISILIFTLIGVKRHTGNTLRRKGFTFTAIMLIFNCNSALFFPQILLL